MSDIDLRERVKTIIAREWGMSAGNVPDDAELNKTPPWDSLGHIRLLLALQRELGLEVTADTVQELVSLPRIVAHLRSAPVAG